MPNLGRPSGHFKNDNVTRRVVIIWFLFILVVLGLYWLGGAFNDW